MSSQSLTVGIPREIKPGEKRVGLTPPGAVRLKESGIRVLIEKGAGTGSGYADIDYEKAGAEIAEGTAGLYEKSGLIKKVKEPVSAEWPFLRSNQVLFSYLHLASPENCRLVQVLLRQKVTAIGLETVEKDGRTIFLEPMSEIAGALAAYDAGWFKKFVRVEQGKIIYPPQFQQKLAELANGFPGVPQDLPAGKAVIFGGGAVGSKAAEIFLKMGGEVVLIEKREDRHSSLRQKFTGFGARFRIQGLRDDFSEALEDADVWMGCVHVVGERAPLVLSPADLEKFSRPKPKLILDVAVDQGGNFPGTHSTTYADPLFLDSSGNLRFGVTNMPSFCGRGASEAIEQATLPYAIRLAQDWRKTLRELRELQTGLQTFDGILVNEAVGKAHQLPWKSFDASKLG